MNEKSKSQTVNEVIEKSQLLTEIMLCIKDYFECTVIREGKSIIITFNNGQKFKLDIAKL